MSYTALGAVRITYSLSECVCNLAVRSYLENSSKRNEGK